MGREGRNHRLYPAGTNHGLADIPGVSAQENLLNLRLLSGDGAGSLQGPVPTVCGAAGWKWQSGSERSPRSTEDSPQVFGDQPSSTCL